MIITIEGNIGSGKSTLLKALKSRYENNPNVIFLKEPVEQWETITDVNGLTMLEKFYKDKEKYSFPFQMMAYISRLALFKDAYKNNPNAVFITERSLQTDKHVFAQMLYDDELIEEVEMQIYLKWFEHFAEDYLLTKVIYVDAEPIKCMKRIAIRNRPGENQIQHEYINNCDIYHKKMLENFSNDQILHIDGNIDVDDEGIIMNSWLDKIDPIISSLLNIIN